MSDTGKPQMGDEEFRALALAWLGDPPGGQVDEWGMDEVSNVITTFFEGLGHFDAHYGPREQVEHWRHSIQNHHQLRASATRTTRKRHPVAVEAERESEASWAAICAFLDEVVAGYDLVARPTRPEPPEPDGPVVLTLICRVCKAFIRSDPSESYYEDTTREDFCDPCALALTRRFSRPDHAAWARTMGDVMRGLEDENMGVIREIVDNREVVETFPGLSDEVAFPRKHRRDSRARDPLEEGLIRLGRPVAILDDDAFEEDPEDGYGEGVYLVARWSRKYKAACFDHVFLGGLLDSNCVNGDEYAPDGTLLPH